MNTDTIIYSNKYGILEAQPITDYKPVREIYGRDVPQDHTFSLETAEQIVLITENRHSQIGFTEFTKHGRGYLVIHLTANLACVAKITRLEYTGPNAQREIANLAPRFSYF